MVCKCHSLIIQRIHDDCLEYAEDKETPNDVCTALIKTFKQKGAVNLMFLLTLKMKEGDVLENYFLEFDKLVRDLKSAGAKMKKDDFVCQLLLTLPKSFNLVVTALETMKI